VTVSEELTQALYRTFFAPEGKDNYEELRGQILALQKAVRKAKKH
jgi:hypothetical protein